MTLCPEGDCGMVGGQKAPGEPQGGSSAPGPDPTKKATDESTRTPATKRGPKQTESTAENPRPQPPKPSVPGSTGHSTAGPGPSSSTPQGCRTAEDQESARSTGTTDGQARPGSTSQGSSTLAEAGRRGKEAPRRSRR